MLAEKLRMPLPREIQEKLGYDKGREIRVKCNNCNRRIHQVGGLRWVHSNMTGRHSYELNKVDIKTGCYKPQPTEGAKNV